MGDEDGDGVKNIVDRCMFKKGPHSNSGCPLPVAYEKLKEGKYYEVTKPDGGTEKVPPPETEPVKESSPAEKAQSEEATKPETQPPKETTPEKPGSCINGTAPATKVWTRQFGRSGYDSAIGIAIDNNENIYIAGTVSERYPGTSCNIFLAKYNSSGKQVWTSETGIPYKGDGASGICIDALGNIYVAGSTDGDLDGNKSAGGTDIVLIKFDPSGKKLWTQQIGGTNADESQGVASYSTNIYITGETRGDLNGNKNAGYNDVFLIKFQNDKQIWTKQFGTTDRDSPHGIAIDKDENIYLTVTSHGDFDGIKNMGQNDIFLVKYNSSGQRIWTRQIGTADLDGFAKVVIDKNGNIIITGTRFVRKYSSSGNEIWTIPITTSTWFPPAASIDNYGNIYHTGGIFGDLDGNKNAGDDDVFLIKYDSSGKKLWTQLMGTPSEDHAYDIATYGANIYITGSTTGDLDGNKNAGEEDIFLTKFTCQ
ncbi:MAG: SBBP repeat-containing protein [Pseudomonadota bacterium]